MRKALLVILMSTAALPTAAAAAPLYFQGFETDTSGWIVSTGGDNNGSITRTPSGGGPLSVPAFNGSYYGTAGNDTNGYQAGYGSGGFTFLNGNGITAPPYPGSPFSQSISVYINTGLSAPSTATPAFWIDMSPSLLGSDGVGCDPAACSDEHNFRLFYNGTNVGVSIDGGTSPAYTIGISGWYTFQDTYAMGPTPASLVQTDMNIYDSLGTLLSSTPELGDSDGGTLLSDNLAGPGYIWLPVWQDGFSNDLLAIDDVRADTIAATVPEPPTWAMMLGGLLSLFGYTVLRRRASA